MVYVFATCHASPCRSIVSPILSKEFKSKSVPRSKMGIAMFVSAMSVAPVVRIGERVVWDRVRILNLSLIVVLAALGHGGCVGGSGGV